MDFSNEPHEFNEDDNVLWLTQHDSEEDVHRKIETFDSLAQYSDSILDCFEHCKEALMILEDNVICAVTGRILLEEENWLYINVTRTKESKIEEETNAKLQDILSKKTKYDPTRRSPTLQEIHQRMDQSSAKKHNNPDWTEQQWFITLKPDVTQSQFMQTLQSIEQLRKEKELPVMVSEAQSLPVPYIILLTDRPKSSEIIVKIANMEFVAGVEENKGGHMKNL